MLTNGIGGQNIINQNITINYFSNSNRAPIDMKPTMQQRMLAVGSKPFNLISNDNNFNLQQWSIS